MSDPSDGSGMTEQESNEIGVEAYIYLYSLVTMEITRRQMTNAPLGARPGYGPAGQFSHLRQFPSAEFKVVVRPNFDTLYSSAWLDLTSGPVVVSAGDTRGRYYVLPMMDMWTDVFAVPGKRTSGTGAQHYVVAPRGWNGAAPDGIETIEAPTPYVWIIGRFQCNGPADYDECHKAQDGLSITPLSRWGQPSTAPEATIDPEVDMTTPPLDQVNGMAAKEYFTLGAKLMALHSPHLTDWSTLARLRRVGIQPGALDYDSLTPQAQAGLDAAPAAAQSLMKRDFPHLGTMVDGWMLNNSTMGVYGDYYIKRAIVSMVGLGANQPQDAVYPVLVTDAAGQPLDGAHNYTMHFTAGHLPPVGAFWSVTMYDADGFQAANELNRFAIGDRDELTFNADGSLDLYLQHENPGADKVSNWLPAPRGPLGVTMRLYAPAPEALDGRWTPPPVVRAAV